MDGKKGKDSFTYVAIDSGGNISDEATVTVNIKKQSTNITYSDMSGNSSNYAALMLAEKGVFTGESWGRVISSVRCRACPGENSSPCSETL
jgi:hypothetical protein